ncbi:MAG: FAD-dependent oxidoreductase, partial [Candidatus Eremiobacteraeota bacterium]|nr:FAD-dependent oxidoreductase [Candidatus Eremiobacteraeota bacterium]
MATLDFDIVIVGASFGGVSAALAAASYGKHIALIDAAGSVGGQATAQGVTRWDEAEDVISPKTYGSSKSYQRLKDDIRGWYRANAKLAPGVDGHTFNPGFFEAGHPFSADCNVVETVLRQLLKDFESQLELMLDCRIASADFLSGTIKSLTLANGDTVTADLFVDATDLGDLLERCGVSWVIGAESESDTGEPHAENVAQRGHIQPITVPIAVEREPEGASNVIPRPANYTQQLIDDQAFGVYDCRNGMIGGVFTSAHSKTPHWETLFDYRKYIDHRNFADPNYANDRTTINVGCNDYQAAVIPTGDTERDAAIVEDARAASRAYLYWLQTEAPHDDGNGTGYSNLKVREDIFGRPDGTSPQAYIRESRRIASPIVRVVEQHIATTS